MTTFATKTKTAENDSQKSHGKQSKSNDLRAASLDDAAPFFNFPIQRKADCACGGDCPNCQSENASLPISQPNDALEIEADHNAEKVMRMTDSEFVPVRNVQPTAQQIQRQCDQCDDEEIQRKEGNSQTNSANHSQKSQVNAALNSGGTNLSSQTRAFFEPRFGHDFSRVKIYNDDRAVKSAQSMNALAYTLGENIVFNQNKYQPETFAGRKLLAHELAHVIQQQSGKVSRMIQKADDATFEANSGVGQGITNGTMTPTSIAGQTFTVNCGNYNMSFKFTKAYKGIYPYTVAARDVKGVYVKIEASITDRRYCGRCTPMRLIQVMRWIQQGSSGNIETAEPTSDKRRERAGWGNASAPSRGWTIDTLDNATTAFTTDLSHTANEGDETSPAILWDVPGHWTTVNNNGKEFYTCAVCEDASHRKWTAACVQWGYYTDSSGNINFRPVTPGASCGYTQQVRDASARWDSLAGNTATGITF